jgi:two-component system copper resistance phosphate regulon response regulator CusR
LTVALQERMFDVMRLLIVEDSDALRTTLAEGLTSLGYEIDASADGSDGLEKAMASRHDAAIVDVMLPGLDGFELVRRLREAGRTLPVLFLTAKDTVEDRVRGLDLGGDDYMVKPFAVDELLARLRSLLRRGKPANQPMVRVSDVAIDTVQHVVTRGGRLVDLSPREYALLEYLALRAGTLVTRQELAEHLFDEPPAEGSNAVDVLVGRLRKKLCPRNLPDLIRTRRGWGYLLEAGA